MKKKARILFWVLADTSRKRTNFYRDWTGIGPRGTYDLKQAERFCTKQEAKDSPAFTFSTMFYEPMPIRKGTMGETLAKAGA